MYNLCEIFAEANKPIGAIPSPQANIQSFLEPIARLFVIKWKKAFRLQVSAVWLVWWETVRYFIETWVLPALFHPRKSRPCSRAATLKKFQAVQDSASVHHGGTATLALGAYHPFILCTRAAPLLHHTSLAHFRCQLRPFRARRLGVRYDHMHRGNSIHRNRDRNAAAHSYALRLSEYPS